MTQENNQPIRNAEAAETINHIPTFEEVYEMPYIQESLRALLMSNSVNYPSLASYEDDIRQEMLIFLAKSLVKFDPAKSEITTFCRMKLETGLIRARRYYRTDSQRAISQAVPLDKLVNAEKQADSGVSSAIRMKTEFYSESPFEKQAWNDAFQRQPEFQRVPNLLALLMRILSTSSSKEAMFYLDFRIGMSKKRQPTWMLPPHWWFWRFGNIMHKKSDFFS